LKPFSGGGWKHVYKVNNKEELLAAYDKTSPCCMTLQEFINFNQYVRCFTFGKTEIVPVHYDPKERKYIVDHQYLSAELGGARRERCADHQPGVGLRNEYHRIRRPGRSALCHRFLNPAPDFERDRITEFYFEHVVEKMARLVIERALNGKASHPWPRWEEMLGIGAAAGFTGAPKSVAAGPKISGRTSFPGRRWGRNEMDPAPRHLRHCPHSPMEDWNALLKSTLLRVPALPEDLFKRLRSSKLTFGDRVHCPFLRPFFLSPEDEERVRTVAETIADSASASHFAALDDRQLFAQLHLRGGRGTVSRDFRLGTDGRVRLRAGCVLASELAEICRI